MRLARSVASWGCAVCLLFRRGTSRSSSLMMFWHCCLCMQKHEGPVNSIILHRFWPFREFAEFGLFSCVGVDECGWRIVMAI